MQLIAAAVVRASVSYHGLERTARRRPAGAALVLLCSWLLVFGCRTAPPPEKLEWRTATIGLCEDYPEETRTLARARRDLAVTRETGAKVLRIAFGWDAMEAEKGRYDWSFWDEFIGLADAEGVRLIPYICYTPKWAASDQGDDFWRSPPRDPQDFARFVETIVTRYRGRFQTWELWNEPDNQAYWLGTPSQFAALIKAGAAAVRRADPQARVVLGGIAGEVDFLAKVLVDEKLGQHVDIVNIHSYFETWHPNPIERLPVYVESVAGLIRDTGGSHPIWMAETGYSSVKGRAEVSSVYRAHYQGEHTEEAQAAALVRTIVLTLASRQVGLVAWYRVNDLVTGQEVVGDDNHGHLGIVSADGRPKPAQAAFAFVARLFAQRHAFVVPEVQVRAANGDAEVHAVRLEDGRMVVFAWMGIPNGPAAAQPAPDNRGSSVRVTLPSGRYREIRMFDAQGRRSGATPGWRHASGRLQLDLQLRGGEVQIIELK